MGTLFIVGTPIGNLEDVSLRALRILKEVDFILCEDTRVTKKLLAHYQIDKPLISYHQHSDAKKVSEIVELLREGKSLAFVTDAGTPGISDPGSELVAEVVRQMPDIRVVPIPGSSALTAVASIAGFPMDKFVFLGFPPAKKGRKKFFEQVAASPYPVILYESPYRIIKTLQELHDVFHVSGFTLYVVVCRELTKKFETIYRGTPAEVLAQLKKQPPRGEFVVAFSPQKK